MKFILIAICLSVSVSAASQRVDSVRKVQATTAIQLQKGYAVFEQVEPIIWRNYLKNPFNVAPVLPKVRPEYNVGICCPLPPDQGESTFYIGRRIAINDFFKLLIL